MMVIMIITETLLQSSTWGAALDPKLGRNVWQAKKLLVQGSYQCKLRGKFWGKYPQIRGVNFGHFSPKLGGKVFFSERVLNSAKLKVIGPLLVHIQNFRTLVSAKYLANRSLPSHILLSPTMAVPPTPLSGTQACTIIDSDTIDEVHL